MTVQDPTKLSIQTGEHSFRSTVRQILAGLYTKGSTFSEPLLALGMGRLRLIATASASNDATVDFTSGIGADHGVYLLTGVNVVPATDNVNLLLRISVAASFKSGASDYSWVRWDFNSGGSGNVFDVADTSIIVNPSLGSDTAEGASFIAIIGGPSNTALHKEIFGLALGKLLSAIPNMSVWGGQYIGGAQAIDGARVLFSSGNVESGEFALYGLGNATS